MMYKSMELQWGNMKGTKARISKGIAIMQPTTVSQ